MLDKAHRIHQDKQYHRLFSTGKKAVGRYMVLLFRRNEGFDSRIGLITSKKVGKAHERNRAKRQLRACTYENFPYLKPGYDLVLIARASIRDAAYEKIVKDFRILLKKNEILKPKEK